MAWVNWGQWFWCHIKFITSLHINTCCGLGNPFTLWNVDQLYAVLKPEITLLHFKLNYSVYKLQSIQSLFTTKKKWKRRKLHWKIPLNVPSQVFWQLVSDYKLKWLGLYRIHCGIHHYPTAWSKHLSSWIQRNLIINHLRVHLHKQCDNDGPVSLENCSNSTRVPKFV